MTPISFLIELQPLSRVFVSIMATVFALVHLWSLWTLARMPSRLRSALSAHAQTPRRPETTAQAYLREAARADNLSTVINATGPVLVTIGILGTFLGLGIAVSEAGHAMGDPKSAVESMQRLMGTVAFKFQSSAWGVLLSIVLVPMRATFESIAAFAQKPFQVELANADAARAEEARNASDLNESLRRSDEERRSDTLIAALGDVARHVIDGHRATQNLLRDLIVSTREVQRAVGGQSHAITTASNALDRAASAIQSAATTLSNSAQAMQSDAERTSKAQSEAATRLSQAAIDLPNGLREPMAAMQTHFALSLTKLETELTSGLSAATTSLSAQLAGSLSKLDTTLTQVTSSVSGSLKAAAEQSESAAAHQGNMLHGALSKLGEESKATSSSIHASLADMSATLSSAADGQRQTTDALKRDIGAALTTVNVTLGESKQYQAKLAAVTEEISDNNKRLVEELDRFNRVAERMTRSDREQGLAAARSALERSSATAQPQPPRDARTLDTSRTHRGPHDMIMLDDKL